MNSTAPRAYRMSARAEAAAATAERVLDATVGLFWENPTDRVSLSDVAERAGVSVQTVIRRFGGRDGLMLAAAERESARVDRERAAAPVGDVAGAVRVLLDHYDQMGDVVLRLLAEERRNPALTRWADVGRRGHRAWCARVFAPWLDRRTAPDATRLLAQLVAVCDVHLWDVLRRQGLDPDGVTTALVEMLDRLLED